MQSENEEADAKTVPRGRVAPAKFSVSVDDNRLSGSRTRQRPHGLFPSYRFTPAAIRMSVASMLAEERRFAHGFLWLPVFAAFGAASEFAAPHDIPIVALVVPLALVAVLATLARSAGRRRAVPLIATTAFLAGMALAAFQIERTGTTILDGEVVTHISGFVTAREGDHHGKWRYTIRLLSTDDPVIRRPPETVRLVARSKGKPIAVGAAIAGLARLSPPSGPTLPGEYDFAFNSFFQGLGAIGFFYGTPSRGVVSLPMAPGLKTRFLRAVSHLRDTIDGRIRSVLPGANGALAAALIVAKRRAIPDKVVEALRAAGLAHILAISGLHMVLVAGTFFVVLRGALGLVASWAERFAIKKIAAGGALVLSTVYLVLSGGAVSTVRAWIMLAIVLTAAILDRPALTLRNVAIAALAIIIVNPAAVVGPGFQMSFAATTALIAAYSALRTRRATNASDDQLRHGIARSTLHIVGAILFTSLIGGLATGIFAAYHFHRLATLGIAGNLLAMPVISFVVMPMGLLSVLLMPYGLEAWPLKAMGAGLDLVIGAAEHVQALGGMVTTGRLSHGELLLFLVGFMLLVLLRSRLCFVGLVPIAAGLLASFSFPPIVPTILISQDGRLVGLPSADGIAINRSRPPSFVFDQWHDALRKRRVIPSRHIHADGSKTRHVGEGAHLRSARAAALRAALDRQRGRNFACVSKKWCAAGLDDGISMVTVEDLAYLGAACDVASIVVTPKPIRLKKCRSGAVLFTGETLRHSGSVEIRAQATVSPVKNAKGGHHGVPVKLTIISALGNVVRPWTVQRYYDWRSRNFNFGAVTPRIQTLVVTAN